MVLWVDQLIIIIIVNMVVDQWMEFFGDCIFQFNGEIGDVVLGVDGIGFNDGFGGIDGYVGDVVFIFFCNWVVDWQGQINQQFVEEKE